MKQNNVLFILSRGRVAAISKKDGTIVWEVKLNITGAAQAIGQLQVEGDKIFVGIKGIMLCLSTKDGALLWKNELKGWGYGFLSLANVSNEAAAGTIAAHQAAATTAAIAAT
jgi:serine protease inhibitor ecotin